MSQEKSWLSNGLVVFISSGVIAVKALLDSFLLESVDQVFLQAFALVFPVIILSNIASVSISNAVIGTASSWIDKERVSGSVIVLSISAAALLGLSVSAGLYVLQSSLIEWFGAQQLGTAIGSFLDHLALWLPLQFCSAVLLQIARYLGLFKSSGLLQVSSGAVGMLTSVVLLMWLPLLPPLVSVVVSNAIIAFCSVCTLLYMMKSRIHWQACEREPAQRGVVGKALSICSTTFLGQSAAVVFIFFITKSVSEQGEAMVAVFAYLTRLEQLILMLAVAFMNVMLPEVAKLIKDEQADLQNYLKKAQRFLLINGVIVACLLTGLLVMKINLEYSMSEQAWTLSLVSVIWLSGTVLQGITVFYSQLLNVLLSPKVAVVLNLFRFTLLGMPLVYAGSVWADAIGIATGLLMMHTISLLIYQHKVNQHIVANNGISRAGLNT
ncbi:hypothetical protein CWC22_005245 [Pseudoalteromonas rubra]|uniref:MATE family efflux transporter n=1 Tax=Pseudoalteromonas rubra TaxID=43658 RepID=A0A5S3UTV0_9GAMM|nr:hypothetical protein [Pseudoalteromonas rubra]QPB82424.1 hypothetical protein CWC22_005245 [Pseudoalteromonas rubra]